MADRNNEKENRERRRAERDAKKTMRADAAAVRRAEKAERVRESEQEWFKIDNAGLIFVPSRSRNWTNLFRFAAVLKDPIQPEILQQAANDLYPRFPTMMVYLKAGLFWNYFEYAPKPPIVREETDYPCRPFDVKARSYLMRILYRGHRIAVEFFHGITDGHGGAIYLMSLVRRYLQLCGAEIPAGEFCLDHRDLPSPEEKEDAFSRYAGKGERKSWSEKQSVQIKHQRAERGTYTITHAVASAAAVKAKAHEYRATVSEFLAGCMMWCLRNVYLEQRTKASENPLKMTLPIDLRRLKPSATLRNFILMYNLEHYPEIPMTLEETIEDIRQQFDRITPDYVQSFIDKNVGTAARLPIRMLPRPIKSLGLNIAYRMFALKQSAFSFSNLGKVDLPAELLPSLERLEFVLGAGKTRGVKASCVTVEDSLVLSFGADCADRGVEASFLKLMTTLGVEFVVDTNRRECNE